MRLAFGWQRLAAGPCPQDMEPTADHVGRGTDIDSTCLSPVDDPQRGTDREFLVVVGDPKHHLLGYLIAHLLSQDAGFFSSLVPVFGIVEIWATGQGMLTLLSRRL